MIKNIVKRDGRVKVFEFDRIMEAIHKAYVEVDGTDHTFYNQYSQLAGTIQSKLDSIDSETIDIEQVQDMVVDSLKLVNSQVAKAYKDYRDKRTGEREHPIDKKILQLLEGTNEFLAKENANKNSTLVSTQRDLMAGTISRHLAIKYMIPQYLVDAHNAGLIKFHDLDYFANPMTNCCLIPLKEMFEEGTCINEQMIETPKSLSTAMTLATQIITGVTSAQYGGTTISLSHLAPYVRVSYEKFKRLIKEEGEAVGIKYTEKQIEGIAKQRRKKEIKDGVQTFNYQISTMSSTNGQSPFVTVFVYLDEDPEYKEETALLAEEFFKQRIKGMKNDKGHYVTQVFPKIIFALDEDNIHKDSEYHWLLRLAMQSTAKRMCPDYISAKVMKELYGECFPCINKACA